GGPVMQRFGPINGLAGRRRLNVLFSRAKEKIVTFSSMTAADIRADEFGNPGTYMLKRWLEYSATGVLEAGSETSREPDSDFEKFVIDQIRSMGCEAVPQVGVAGYFVDIGVKHPEWPHGYILGVECDGASYHSSISARDRDRLRQEVLENLGWHFHRIWSTDWFNDPQKEATRLRERISERLADLQSDAGAFEQQQFAEETTPEVSVPEPEPQPHEVTNPSSEPELVNPGGVVAGDTVTVRYLSGSQSTLTVEVSDKINDPDNGLVGLDSPLGEALLDSEEGEEIEFLAGNYIQRILVERVVKAEATADYPVMDRDEGTYFQPEPRLPLKPTSVQENVAAFEPPPQGPATTSGLSADRFLGVTSRYGVKSDTTPSRGSWSGKGVVLPHATELRMEYSGRHYFGTIDHGQWLVEGDVYDSPSAASRGVTGTSRNGWRDWEVKRPSDSRWVHISGLRQTKT
ncbi:MAG: GreA/GreB family elongation factor, partial [Rhodospirillaceae bacterium]|nr:GreA/GreB family elongation factor [Rhodospirillaceae bacterium]